VATITARTPSWGVPPAMMLPDDQPAEIFLQISRWARHNPAISEIQMAQALGVDIYGR
jgi:hypothetical protein